jgi:hypothetical protein
LDHCLKTSGGDAAGPSPELAGIEALRKLELWQIDVAAADCSEIDGSRPGSR